MSELAGPIWPIRPEGTERARVSRMARVAVTALHCVLPY